MHKYIIGLISILLLTSISFAVPIVTDVNQSTSVITGSSFGTKTTAAPIKFDTFESYTDGGNILNSGTSPQWVTNSGNPATDPIVATTKSHSGTKSVYNDFSITVDDCSFNFAYIEFADTDDFYQTYWVYWDSATGERVAGPRRDWFKMSRVSADIPYSGAPVQRPEWWVDYGIPEALAEPRGYLIFECSSDPDGPTGFVIKTPGGTPDDFTHGSWHRVEIFSHLSATEGVTTLVIDGVTQTFSTDSGDPNETRVSSSLQGYNTYQLEVSGCGYTAIEHPYMWQDDLYIDNTRSRVEIGNASTFSACTHREIQPATSWATGEITYTENQGTLPNNGNYLFVIDDNGDPSNGVSVSFGVKETSTASGSYSIGTE